MITRASLRKILFILSAIVIVFSCSDNENQRDSTRKALGDPDEIIQQNYATFKSELWVYARSDINRVYEFQKSASGCGGSGEWYLYRRYYADYHFGYDLYDPQPVITHEPVVWAPPGKAIKITTDVKLHPKATIDTFVKAVNLQYRITGDSLFNAVNMSIIDTLFVGTIPSDMVTTTGVEYYLEGTSDQSTWNKWSRLPKDKDGVFSVAVSADTTGVMPAEKAGFVVSNATEFDRTLLPEPGDMPGRASPLGP